MKWNANTGKKVWGTFYGTPLSTMYTGSGISAIEVNSTGIYVSGQMKMIITLPILQRRVHLKVRWPTEIYF